MHEKGSQYRTMNLVFVIRLGDGTQRFYLDITAYRAIFVQHKHGKCNYSLVCERRKFT